MTEEPIISWMKEELARKDFTDASSMAKAFVDEHNITDTLAPEFSKTINAGFKVANDIASC